MLTCGEVVRAVESCFADAVPVVRRRNIAANGLPIGLYNQHWDSAQLLTHVLLVLIPEFLGYNVVISGLGPASRPSIIDFVGCREEGLGIICPPGPYPSKHPHHALIESWAGGTAAYNEVVLSNPELFVDMIPLGYEGHDGHYVPAGPLMRAQERGMHLEYYSELNAQWRSPWEYFDSYKSIDVSRLLPCVETQNAQPLVMAPVIQWTPDPGGFDTNGKAICQDGYWWLAPECRHNTTRCVPYLTGGNGWFLISIMQRAIGYHLPLAIAVAADWNNYKSIPLEFSLLAYSWHPSMHFIGSSFTQIIFPPTNLAEQKLGDFRTEHSSEILKNVLIGGLDLFAPPVHAFLKKVRLTSLDIRSLLQLMASTGDYSVAACSWLSNTTAWRLWLPDVKQCSREGGLVSQQGEFTDNFTLAASCTPCSSGRFSQRLSGTIARVCTLCSPGEVQPMWGMDTCNSCLLGYYQDKVGQSLCERCGTGRYSNSTGRRQCADCPEGKTTDGTGLTSVLDCGCPPSTHLDSSGQACVVCQEGMICEGFNTPVLAEFGYQLSMCGPDPCVFKCHKDPFRCPGGGLHQCSSGRTGIACAECEPGTREASDSTCVKCESADASLIVLVLVALGSFNATLYYKNITARSSLSVTFDVFCAILTQLLMVLQTLSAVATMNIGWLMLSKQVLEAFTAFAFDIDWAHATCIHDLSVERRYVLRCMVTPVCIALLILGHICVVIIHCCKSALSNRSHQTGLLAQHKLFLPLQASICDFVMSFLFSIVTTFLSPFRCSLNPNRVWTMDEYESQICWQSRQHTRLIFVASSLVLVVLAFVAYILWILYRLEARLSGGDVDFLRANNFLFARIRPHRLWFAFVVVLRNLGVAILLVLPNAIWQAFTVEVIIVLYSLIVFKAEPWRFSFLNLLDSFFGMDLLLIFACMFIKLSGDSSIDTLVVSAIACLGFAVVVALAWAFLRHTRCGISKFRFYLCYHTQSAGALARLLYLYLCHTTPLGGGTIFLSADCLSRMDIQLWWIENDTRTFLVILTSQLFHSPWCLGEITTAVNHDLPMRLLYVPSFVPSGMSHYNSIIESDCGSILTVYGIKIRDVKLAVSHLLALLASGVEHPLSLKSLETSLSQIARDRRLRKSSTPSHVQNDELVCVLLHDRLVEESLMSTILLKQFLGTFLLDERMNVQLMLLDLKVELPCEVFPAVKIAILSCLTHGCFHSNEFVSGLIFCSVLPGVVVNLPIVMSDNFQYLTAEGKEILLDDVESFCAHAALPENLLPDILTFVKDFTKSMLNTLLSLFSAQSDQTVLRLQTNAIWRRIETGLRQEMVMGTTDVKQILHDWMCTEAQKQLHSQYDFSEGPRMNLDSLDAFSSECKGEETSYKFSL